MIDEIANPRPVLVGETVRGHGRQDHHVRRVREPGARPRRPGPHLEARARQAPAAASRRRSRKATSSPCSSRTSTRQGKISLKPVGEEWAIPEGRPTNPAADVRAATVTVVVAAVAAEAATVVLGPRCCDRGSSDRSSGSGDRGERSRGRRFRDGEGAARPPVARARRPRPTHPPATHPPPSSRHQRCRSHRTEFSSGLRVVTERMPSVRSVSLGFWVLAGSRDEAPADQRVQPLPRAPALQGHRAPDRAGHRRELRRGGR